LGVTNAANANGNCPNYWAGGTGTWSGSPAAGGSGTPQDPYLVGSQDDLNEVRYCQSSHFRQVANVTLVGEWTPITNFTGGYQGAGRTIDGLTIAAPVDNTVGLFGTIDGGTVADVSLTNVAINAPQRSHVGALAGQTYAPASMSGISAAGSVVGTGPVGGLVGYVEESEISNSHADVAVTAATGSYSGGLAGLLYDSAVSDSSASGTVTGSSRTGGLAGGADASTTIMNSRASGDVSSQNQVGGLVGVVWGVSVTRSSATGAVLGTDAVGGLIGKAYSGTQTVANSFATGNTEAGAGSSGGLIGDNDTTGMTVLNSYQSGTVTTTGQAGGLIGVVSQQPANITESFWNSTANPGLSGGPGASRTREQLRDISTFANAGWAIQKGAPATGGNVWGICVPASETVNSGYPFLQWNHDTNPCQTVPPIPARQRPAKNCVTSGSNSLAIPRRGSMRLMKPGCVTNAGKRIGVRVTARLRGDAALYRLTCKVSNKKQRSVSRGASGYYCKAGALRIQTFDYRLRLRVGWSAKATTGYDAYHKNKAYRT